MAADDARRTDEPEIPTGDPEIAAEAPGGSGDAGADGALLEPRDGTIGDDAMGAHDHRHAAQPGEAVQATDQATGGHRAAR